MGFLTLMARSTSLGFWALLTRFRFLGFFVGIDSLLIMGLLAVVRLVLNARVSLDF